MTTKVTPEAVLAAYEATEKELEALRLDYEEKVAPLQAKQEARENWMLASTTNLDFATERFVALRNEKTRLTKLTDTVIPERMAVFTQFLANQMAKLNVDSIKTKHGTPYFVRKESVTIADWDAFLNYVKDGHWEFLNHAANKTSVLEVMGVDRDQPPPPGVNYSSVRDVTVRKS